MHQHQSKNPDLGFIPESKLVQSAGDGSFYEYGIKQNGYIQQLIKTADLQLQPFSDIEHELVSALQDKDNDMVYRALIVATSYKSQAKKLSKQVKELLNNSQSIPVKSRALEFLVLVDDMEPTQTFYSLYNQASHDLEKV